jgi:hypothetical protein
MATDSYFSALQQEYQNANNKLHPSKKLVHGIIPQMYDESNVAFAKNPLGYVKEGARRFVNIDARDIEFGVITASGELKKYIPIHHVGLMEDVHVSKDLLRSTLIFSEMADNYKSMNDTLPSVSILTDLIKGNVKLNIDSRTTVGVKDAVTKAAWTGADAQKINNQLLEFLDKVVYGEYEIVDKIPGTNISLNKLANKVGALSSAVQLMGNITSAINNATIGNFNNIVQSIGSKYFTQGEYASATATYASSLPSLIQDVANGVPKSKIGILAEIYDAIQGEYTDGYGRKISGTLARKLFTTDAGYFLTKATEQQIQYTGMIALLKGTKVKTSTGEMISLWDAYDEKGKLKAGVKFTEDDRFQVMQTMHKLNKEMHGVYNKFDSPTLQRRWYGKLAMMFMKLCERYATRSNWRGYTYNEEMRGQALLQLSQIGLQFDESKSQNPFAYYTAAITNSFTRILNLEKKNQNIRDDILEINGLNPSWTRQNSGKSNPDHVAGPVVNIDQE